MFGTICFNAGQFGLASDTFLSEEWVVSRSRFLYLYTKLESCFTKWLPQQIVW